EVEDQEEDPDQEQHVERAAERRPARIRSLREQRDQEVLLREKAGPCSTARKFALRPPSRSPPRAALLPHRGGAGRPARLPARSAAPPIAESPSRARKGR